MLYYKLGRPPDQANAVTRPQSRNAESKQRPTSKERRSDSRNPAPEGK